MTVEITEHDRDDRVRLVMRIQRVTGR